jgi:two-component system response regulator HydG
MEDFEFLAHTMLDRQGSIARFGADAMETLSRHSWPGNLAELWKVTSHVARLGRIVEVRDLPELVPVDESAGNAARLDQVMQRHVLEVLQRCSGNKLRAAELLGISRSTLYRMLEAAGDATAE